MLTVRLLTALFIALLLTIPAPAEEQPDSRDTETKRLTDLYNAETDPAKKQEYNRQLGELFTRQANEDVARFLPLWRAETDPAKKKDLGEQLITAAVHSEQPKIVLEVATNGMFSQKEIKIRGKEKRIPLRLIESFTFEPAAWSNPFQWVIRRMTSNRLELWDPYHGWLFNRDGRVIAEARPPRRDGSGRQWYGAFLPDGRWVTTDLWDMDRTLHFFSALKKWEKDISADDLVPRTSDDDRYDTSLIGWCRCDRNGKGFVLNVGANGGRGDAWVNWKGDHHTLTEHESPWKLCYPRDLEPKGTYTMLFIPNDNGDLTIDRQEPGHGMWVGYPTYRTDDFEVVVPGGETFGFWPKSRDFYVVTAELELDNDLSESSEQPEITWTLFYNDKGSFLDWIEAKRLTDDSEGNSMLFVDRRDRVIKLTTSGHRMNGIQRFVWPDGSTANPYRLFSDLRIGFFRREDQLVLAAW